MKTATQRDYEERILLVLVHIQKHLDHAMDWEQLAVMAHFSPFHFHRVFRGMVGEPVMEHVRRLRLERAAFQLKTTDRSVTEVAFAAGYEAHEAFTRAFRSMFDASPTVFREQHRRIPTPKTASSVHYTPDGKLETFQPLQRDLNAMNARIEELSGKRVTFMRHVGPYDQVGATWQRFMKWAASRGILQSMTAPLAVVHDDPEITPPDKLRYDVCLAVDEVFQPSGDVGVQEIGAGPYAVATHKGPYERLGETYSMLIGQWLPARDREAADLPCLEVYRNNPQTTPAEELLTDLYVPLRPR